jgi:aspartate oxidase
MYHSTIYGGSHGYGKTVDEARLNAVLGLARAICDDGTAFNYDAEEIFKAQQLSWWQSRIQQEREELELLEEDKPGSNRYARKIERRIKLLEQLQGEWQEEHDYWPEEAREATRPSATPAAIAAVRVSAPGVADRR